MLLVEGHDLLLLALLVVLVALLDPLHLRRQSLQRLHRAHLLEGEREDRQPHDDREADDREPPAEPHCVVPELDDRVVDVDQGLEDVRDYEHRSGRVAGCVTGTEQRLGRDGVDPTAAPRIAAHYTPCGENAPAEATEAHARDRPTATAEPWRRRATATAASERQAATTATASAPSAVPSRLSSRKTAKRNGESCLLSAALNPESGMRAERTTMPAAIAPTASRRGQPRAT